MKKILLTALSALLFLSVFADEGMWLLQLLKQQKYAEMKAHGLKLNDYDIYNPNGNSIKDAIVQFGRGCTGEVVSSEGLILTNHHCGYDAIQNHSTVEHNYLEDGFWALSKAQELPNPGLTVTFIDKIDDVTEYVKTCLKRDAADDKDGVFFLSPKYLNGIAKQKVGEDFLKNNVGTEVEIKPFFNGNLYLMFTKKIYSDIRLVGAPPSSIGKFGADTDNWMWPRHTGDFSVFRIYADSKGNPAPYSKSNVPLKPKRWLKISTQGVNQGDFAMIMGFPGSTQKFYTAAEVVERRDIDNTVRINMREVRQKAMLEEMLKDPKVKIQYSSKYAGSTNGYKSAIGSNWAIDKRNFVASKKKMQDDVMAWAKKNKHPEYVQAIEDIEKMVKERAQLRFRQRMIGEGLINGVEFSTISTKNKDLLLKALQEKNATDIEKYKTELTADYHRFADKDYNAMVDQKVATAVITEYVRLTPRENLPTALDAIYTRFNGNVADYVADIFKSSIFGSEENLSQFMANVSEKALREDAMFAFAESVRAENASLVSQLSSYDNPFDKARKVYVQGILQKDGALAYAPDANLTLRYTFGKVNGYEPRDGVSYSHQTTMDGIMEKEDATNWEFVVSPKLKKLYENRDFGRYAMPNGKMPVAFSATTHTTGGNSGSPVMNANGELIGINFDRNWEGVGGDIQYLPDFQRSIIVDIRYVLFVIEKYGEATNLIQEMDIK